MAGGSQNSRAIRRAVAGLELSGGQALPQHVLREGMRSGAEGPGPAGWDPVVLFLASVLVTSVGIACTPCLSSLSCKRRGGLSSLMFGGKGIVSLAGCQTVRVRNTWGQAHCYGHEAPSTAISSLPLT